MIPICPQTEITLPECCCPRCIERLMTAHIRQRYVRSMECDCGRILYCSSGEFYCDPCGMAY